MSTAAEAIKRYMQQAQCRRIRQMGNEVAGTCPFHQTKDGLPFSINTDTGYYQCFSCGERGHLAFFLQRLCGFGVKEAQREARLIVSWDEEYVKKKTSEEEVTESQVWVARELLKSGEKGSRYLRSRFVTKEMQERWELGEMEGMLVFPLRSKITKSLYGAVVRALDEVEKGYRYKHIGGGKKEGHFYGEDKVSSWGKEVLLVEGMVDTIMMEAISPIPVLGTFGTNITKSQKNILTNFERVIMMFDRDAAGLCATKRIGQDLYLGGSTVEYVPIPPTAKDPAELLTQGFEVLPWIRSHTKSISTLFYV